MHIAILGATSQIARDLIVSFSKSNHVQLSLFARRPQAVHAWLNAIGLSDRFSVKHFDGFSGDFRYDAVINFVGVGNLAQAAVMGASILDVTYFYDSLALNYLQKHPDCRYIFLSSGAAYGSSFLKPANRDTVAMIPINNLHPQEWYGVAKLHAETRHRAAAEMPIVDVRVFNYFSNTQDMSDRYLITDIVRAISNNTLLKTSTAYMKRDFLTPSDFYQLICQILIGNPVNTAVDCFTLDPVDKPTLLIEMQEKYSLKYQFIDAEVGINATGSKPFYYSTNRSAEVFGYKPNFTSITGLFREIDLYLQSARE
jgi:nucleoside-diphosphate-sugar epimerase